MTPRRNPAADTGGDERRGLDTPSGWQNVPDFPLARRHVVTELIRFVTRLREASVDVPATGSLDGARALAVVGLSDRAHVADALQATLLTDEDARGTFDEEFSTFWHRLRTGLDRIATDEGAPSRDEDEETPASMTLESSTDEPVTLPDAEVPPAGSGDPPGDVDVRIGTDRRHVTGEQAASTGDDTARRYSAVGSREAVGADSVPLSDGENAAVDRFVDALVTIAGRRTRAASDGDVDARRALRASLATGGTPIDLPAREPVPSELRCCLLVDVSGSVLDTVDRGTLLAFAEQLQTTARTGSVFLFDTDLVDATLQFDRARGDPAAALRAAEISWGGGTRIGDAFETLQRAYPHAVDRRTVVVVVSDGLDVGDQETLERAITWLAGRAHAVVWLNPLAVSSAYEPQSRGMATCLPYLDGLFGFAEPADLDEAARQLERHGIGGPIGYEYDARRFRDDGQRTSEEGATG